VAKPATVAGLVGQAVTPLDAFAEWLEKRGEPVAAAAARKCGQSSALGAEMVLPGPVGERNVYALHPRGRVLLRPRTSAGLFAQMAAVLATGNRGTIEGMLLPEGLPASVAAMFEAGDEPLAGVLVEGDAQHVAEAVRAVAALPGAIVPVHAAGEDGQWDCDRLLEEVSISINTTAAGGNASLMMIG
jgi:RHH-type proline utilization regulon transcriptional repressor/proline dehydrogenase/delta 1-pyrroline-5-carboxylate dehydrogenase